ncbi:metal cation transporter, ZIP family protein (macronuclear) [Tetrahymena thermophila SB210]|uniref:Metal cation transporter, ZIP family protein n=1 Tax=Tetrahymena thermophila (strain SB210) TaxID=312017 RepID=Q23QR5_TETTS|nr:metal cation transporter, ZIP family protein [Tetrahymena thermophila SB210]EAR98823.1 metal cation transporter, ZIP family protein [Tetrahymena thermophila SB210]|eukprot:XP_001019068.1 metal cation transporter, ZIP family protein [Tetrahymena thermophila SB210]
MSDTTLVKSLAIVFMYIIVLITGSLPLRIKSFKENKKLLSISSAFSGGLFISIGLIHILPDASDSFDSYYSSQSSHFPFQMFITVISFSFVLFLEKILGEQFSHHFHHNHCSDQLEECQAQSINHNNNNLKLSEEIGNQINNQNLQNKNEQLICQLQLEQVFHQKNSSSQDEQNQPDQLQQNLTYPNIRTTIIQIQSSGEDECKDFKLHKVDSELNSENAKQEIIQKSISEEKESNFEQEKQQIKQLIQPIDIQLDKQEDDSKMNIITPFVLQIALGIHATLEGLSIGVEQDFSQCITISLAVLVHKWAEGLVLGLALKQSKMTLTRATIMLAIQAAMNPIGIGIGWALSDAGDLVSGILMSISAGTFIYIATQEVIAQEFSKNRYQIVKFIFFLVGVGFISSLYFVEQATG